MRLREKVGYFKGWIWRPWWALRAACGIGPKIVIGKRFSLQGGLQARGAGTLVIHDDVTVGDRVTPFLHSPSARIEIGSKTFLNGTRFGASKLIRVGARCILADVRIMDTDFHPVHGDRFDPQNPVGVAEVSIEDDVWIAGAAAVLKGVTIGAHSMIAFGSVVAKSIPPSSIAAGVPAQVVGAVKA